MRGKRNHLRLYDIIGLGRAKGWPPDGTKVQRYWQFGRVRLSAIGCTILLDFGGISFLEDGYEIEHTLPIEDTIDALQIVCARNARKVA